ncbi:hypothetical protein ABZ016_24640 [Streptomyces sp. NPDC006372]|uniref:hypothetical protein n=1 Tax=Streptomyces sp. NPDC006372 TaxID=3155599 RepID=UPI0033BBBE97
MTSALGKNSRLAKLAEESTKNQAVQREMNALINKLMDGNDQPGKGSSGLSGGIRYLRGHERARLFFRLVDGGWEIVGKSDKEARVEGHRGVDEDLWLMILWLS